MEKVAPRDIFNDANFLKNLAFLTVHMKSGTIKGIDCNISDDSLLLPGFLSIDPSSGDAFAAYGSFYATETQEHLGLGRPMNSREPFPLFFTDESEGIYDIFYDDGTLRSDIEDIADGDDNCRINLDPQKVMAQSIAMKGIGKLALSAIDRIEDVRNIDFDERKYSKEGIKFSIEDGHFHLENKNLVSTNMAEIYLRSPVSTTNDDLWPLEFKLGNGDFARVYERNGDFSQEFKAMSLGNNIKPDISVPDTESDEPALRRRI
jgi:hypothetical protein|tara:strand:+ start:2263 stop:3048 length:786 start_codon:yes stop_codon:yes gene_type:complete